MLSHFILRNLLCTVILCLVIIGISAASSIDTARWEEGRSLFKADCASCHNPAIAQTGPALTGVTARWDAAGDFGGRTGKQWLYAWIRDWKGPVDAQYPYAVKVQNYSASQMSIFPSLSDNDIASILVYVENPHAISAIPDHKSEKGTGWSNIILYVFGGLVAISLAVLFMVGRRNKN
jgi:mono/diheme cytochrome c family protein